MPWRGAAYLEELELQDFATDATAEVKKFELVGYGINCQPDEFLKWKFTKIDHVPKVFLPIKA